MFVAGAAASLLTSWVLVVRIERIGARLGASEALLGLLAALAADAPEITSAVSALTRHQTDVGAGVVVGSNVFNLAALLGLAAVVAGGIRLHRPVVVLAGAVALGVAGVTVATATGALPVGAGLGLTLAILAPAVALAMVDHSRLHRLAGRSRLGAWLDRAVTEEELDLEPAIHPRRGRGGDVAVGAVALAVVVVASVAMERAATDLGHRVPGIVIGGIVLAAVTSLPNAVAAVYLARRGRGAAVLSTAMNSNALNVAAGFMIPAAILGAGRTNGSEVLVCGWYAGLTAVALLLAWRGLTRRAGALILAAYAGFVAVVVIGAGTDLAHRPVLVYLAPGLVLAATVALVAQRPPQ